jgi:hypothetical protein
MILNLFSTLSTEELSIFGIKWNTSSSNYFKLLPNSSNTNN